MNSKKIMIITFSILGFLLLIYLIGKINLKIKFNHQVKKLFSQSENISNKSFHKSQINSLPEPVQRYFNLVLKENQPYINSVRMTHSGQFKTGLDKDWINITGEQYATSVKPGFIWKGTTIMFTAFDIYIEDKGRLMVSLFGLYNIIDGKGEHYDQGELLRWLGESVLYPTNLLPSENLNWIPIDSCSAKLTFNYNGLSLFFKITFNDIGEITQMETKRYMDENNLETWIIKVAQYKEINNVFVPTSFEVLWRLSKGDFSYAKFNITGIVYNKPVNYTI